MPEVILQVRVIPPSTPFSFAKTRPGLDVKKILHTSHGVRTNDNLAKWCGIAGLEVLKDEVDRFERAIIESADNDITILPGVRSATTALKVANIDAPAEFVTADDAGKGTPHPDPYLGVVVEDGPAGVTRGLDARSRVIGLLTTHSMEQMLKAAETACEGYFGMISSSSVVVTDDGVAVTIPLG
ncbi:hypothetical protein PAXRUDRAFT_30106 [Paxillus rubicundulus Ve08.2h10]|uniref:Uncharacterized protein n=1 Tax=Paxillus rubicundulus Ve08.2h10 TaxID=930991 RepID=A0A0D0ECW2_9AGAM|nr:hypothetical protein PAXRUDRAFT_30106 [Paxillus rubicundulus Ve08.2h10]